MSGRLERVALWRPSVEGANPVVADNTPLNGLRRVMPDGTGMFQTGTGLSVVAYAENAAGLASPEKSLKQPAYRLVWLDDFSGAKNSARPADGRSTQDCLDAFNKKCTENGVEALPPLRKNSHIYALRPVSGDYLSDHASRKVLENYGPDVKQVRVAVCDPGVGGAREAIVVETSQGYVVGPNNGVFSRIFAREGIKNGEDGQARVFKVRAAKFEDVKVPTFHGEAVFAPLAGYIAAGIDPSQLTEWLEPFEVENLKILPRVENQVMDVDHLNFLRVDTHMPERQPTHARVTVTDRETGATKSLVIPAAEKFVDVGTGQLLVFNDSDIDPQTGRNYVGIAAANAVHEYENHAVKQVSVRYGESPVEPGDILGIDWLYENDLREGVTAELVGSRE